MAKVNEITENPCAIATTEQGLDPVVALRGWEIEQTGGYTMVAYRYFSDGTALSVTQHEQTKSGDSLYLICFCHEAKRNFGSLGDDHIVEQYQTLDQVEQIGLSYLSGHGGVQ